MRTADKEVTRQGKRQKNQQMSRAERKSFSCVVFKNKVKEKQEEQSELN